MSRLSFPDNLIHKAIFPEDLVEHDFDVVGGVPIAVVVEGAGFLEDAPQLDAAGAHVVDVCLRASVAVLEGPLLLRLTPEDLVVAVGVEGRVDVDEVHGAVGEFLELIEVVATVDDAGVEEGGGFCGGRRAKFLYRLFLFCHRV